MFFFTVPTQLHPHIVGLIFYNLLQERNHAQQLTIYEVVSKPVPDFDAIQWLHLERFGQVVYYDDLIQVNALRIGIIVEAIDLC